MAEIAREPADLTSVVRVVLHKIGQHVDRSSRHPFDPGAAVGDRGFKETSEILGRSPQRALSVDAR